MLLCHIQGPPLASAPAPAYLSLHLACLAAMPQALAPPLMAAFRPRLRPPLLSPSEASSLSYPRHILLTFGDFAALLCSYISRQFGIQLRHAIPSRHMNTHRVSRELSPLKRCFQTSIPTVFSSHSHPQ